MLVLVGVGVGVGVAVPLLLPGVAMAVPVGVAMVPGGAAAGTLDWEKAPGNGPRMIRAHSCIAHTI